MTVYLDQLVTLPVDFKPSVQLPNDFYDEAINAQLLANFLPTEQSISLLREIAQSMHPNSNVRARILHGTFGTGKSDLLLMLANYYLHDIDSAIMEKLYSRIRDVNAGVWENIRNQRRDRKPFLIVLLQANAERPFSGFVLHGLHRALSRAGLTHLMSETKYAAATKKIYEWQQHYPDIYARFERLLQENESKEIISLIAELDSASADLVFQAFERTFHKTTGTEFNIFEYDEPYKTYKQVARALVRQGTHSGILIVIDEFTALLRRFARSSDAHAEALVLQNLAEAATSSDKDQLHFLVAGLEPFASAANQTDSSGIDKIIEQIGGRFKHFALEVQGSEDLLRGALQRTAGTDATLRLPNGQRDELLTIAEKLWLPMKRERNWIRQVIVDGTFPLHPITTFLLPKINQKVAQNQRTMFLFLNDAQGLPASLATTTLQSSYISWHNLITPDVLFDYFRESIEARHEDIVDAYRRAEMQVQAATVDTSLARRILKIIAVCEVVSPFLSSTRQIIQQALNLPDSAHHELDQALQLLDDLSAIHIPGEIGGAYALLLGDRVNSSKMRRLLATKAAELDNRVSVDSLNTDPNWKPLSVNSDEYNRVRGSTRSLRAIFVSPATLKNEVRIKKLLSDPAGRLDGIVLYVITDSETERQEALSYARQITSIVAHQRLVIAIPEKPTLILNRLRIYQALGKVRLEANLSEREREYLSDKGRIGQELTVAFTQELQRLKRTETWIWCHGGEISTPGKSASSIIASRAMERTFPDTPAHAIAQHLKADPLSKAEKLPSGLQRAIEELLNQTVRVPRIAKGQEWSILRSGVERMGLLRPGQAEPGYEVLTLTSPDVAHQASLKVWRQFEQLEKNPNWSRVVDTLREPPFGLYDSLILLFAASFFSLRADELLITRGSTKLPLTTNSIAEIVASPTGVTIKLQPLSEFERRWLHAIVERGLGKKIDISSGPLRERVATQVRQWLSNLKLPLFVEGLRTEDVRRFLPDERVETIDAIYQLVSFGKAGDVATLLTDTLPVALGLSTNHSLWKDQELTETIHMLSEVFLALKGLSVAIESHAIQEVAAVFGATHATAEDNWKAIYQWRGIRNAVNAPDLSTETRFLFLVLNDPTGSVKGALLNNFASSVQPSIGAYDTWPSLQKLANLTERLTRAVQQIDEHWKRNAPQEEVWLNGVAQAAFGRNVSEHKPEKIAHSLAEWATNAKWSACAGLLNDDDLQQLYPERNRSQITDLQHLLRRRGFSAARWADDLSQSLATDFGVVAWQSQHVTPGIQRFAQALADASAFDERLRQHILNRLSSVFVIDETRNRPIAEVINSWLAAHPIAVENDLSEQAQILLHQLGAGGALETLLTERLPRAYSAIGTPYRQWQGYRELETYVTIITAIVCEIQAYTPLTPVQERWLSRIADRINVPVERPSLDLYRLSAQVHNALQTWRVSLNLPVFATLLRDNELRELTGEFREPVIAVAQLLLSHLDTVAADATFVLTALPNALGVQTTYQEWTEATIELLDATLAAAITLVQSLRATFEASLVQDAGSIAGDQTGLSVEAVAHSLRTWRRSFILSDTQKLSEHARALAELSQSIDDPYELITRRLPQRLSEQRVPYEAWRRWDERQGYQRNLHAAAAEIARAGQIHEASQKTRALWHDLRTDLDALSDDDRRWFLKQFYDAFPL